MAPGRKAQGTANLVIGALLLLFEGCNCAIGRPAGVIEGPKIVDSSTRTGNRPGEISAIQNTRAEIPDGRPTILGENLSKLKVVYSLYFIDIQ